MKKLLVEVILINQISTQETSKATQAESSSKNYTGKDTGLANGGRISSLGKTGVANGMYASHYRMRMKSQNIFWNWPEPMEGMTIV